MKISKADFQFQKMTARFCFRESDMKDTARGCKFQQPVGQDSAGSPALTPTPHSALLLLPILGDSTLDIFLDLLNVTGRGSIDITRTLNRYNSRL